MIELTTLKKVRKKMKSKVAKEFMNLLQIQEAFDSEWILLEDPETTEALEVIRGKVLFHSKNRDDVYKAALQFKPTHSAVIYTGQFSDKNTAILI